ncbi:MAG: DUF2268 domain-containing putative Zn-dependent protease [Defluviitaleaceae bacterium]|nr:DUF2268 domain-containing putative Zn-dependent protease [Defluviitaleaceae bacterium]
MKIDIKAARLGRMILEMISKKDMPSDKLLYQYYYSGGIQFLNDHLKHYGGFELTIEKLKDYFASPNTNNVFEKSIHLGLSKIHIIDEMYLDRFEETIKSIEIDTMKMVEMYLPVDLLFPEINVYLLFGIRGTAIVLNNNIAIDLCDDGLYENGRIETGRLQRLLAHEIHHIGVMLKFLEFSRRIDDEKELQKYLVIENIISEGMACFYLTPDIISQNEKQWNKNLTDIDTKIDTLKFTLDDYSIKGNEIAELQNSLFDDSLLGYTIGYVMIQRIHNKMGMDGVITLLTDFNLFDIYAKLSE